MFICRRWWKMLFYPELWHIGKGNNENKAARSLQKGQLEDFDCFTAQNDYNISARVDRVIGQYHWLCHCIVSFCLLLVWTHKFLLFWLKKKHLILSVVSVFQMFNVTGLCYKNQAVFFTQLCFWSQVPRLWTRSDSWRFLRLGVHTLMGI